VGNLKKNSGESVVTSLGTEPTTTYHKGGTMELTRQLSSYTQPPDHDIYIQLEGEEDFFIPSGVEITIDVSDREAVAKEIQKLQIQLKRGTARILYNAIQVGKLLTAVKATFPDRASKGNGFYDWTEDTLGYVKSTAVRYEKAWAKYSQYFGEGRLEGLVNMTLGALVDFNPNTSEKNNTKPTVIEVEEAEEADIPFTEAVIVSDSTATGTEEDTAELMATVFDLNPQQEKRAMSYASYFGGSELAKQQARRMVLARIPNKADKKTEVVPTVIKRTVRYNPIIDGYIQNVVGRTERSYTVVNEELVRIGLSRFKKKYGIS